MLADPEDRERLAREVAGEIAQRVGALGTWTPIREIKATLQPILLAFAQRVREPLEKELEEWRGLQPTFKAAMERLSSEFQQLEADADSLRSQLSEAQAELKEVTVQRDLALIDARGAKAMEGPSAEDLLSHADALLALSEARAEVEDTQEQSTKFRLLYHEALEREATNDKIVDFFSRERDGFKEKLSEAQQRVERLTGALTSTANYTDHEGRFCWCRSLPIKEHIEECRIARAALSEEPATGACAKRGPGVWAHVIPAGATACTECGEPATGVEE